MAIIPRTAMVFAAGLGTRMLPLTKTTPKPLVKVAGKTLLDYRLDALQKAGVERVFINTHHLAEQVQQAVIQRKDISCIIRYEEELLDTGGTLVSLQDELGDDPIFVINGDVIWQDGAEDSLQKLAHEFQPEHMDMLLLLIQTEKAFGYEGKGDFYKNSDGSLYVASEAGIRPFVFSGVQILHPRVLVEPPSAIFSLSHYFRRALQNAQASGHKTLYGTVHKGEWYHVGTIPDIAKTESYLHQHSITKQAVASVHSQ
jgi:N-acetyl-alpha-D-muramate 1-phosphate uridylyltransferase